jgi:acyl carrier protein
MLDRIATTNQVAEIVHQALPPGSATEALSRDANLYDAGLTSMAMVKLMLAVEVAFDISIPDEDLHPDNFRSMGAIESLVARLQQP